ncbi:hypothetical protein SLUN_38960 (plasmid) [Streptomyces lunaelactis]|uniref:Uncharacterized protein n=1 Tax=Streptomyces lunaelactis TaxID=1535768 RepID=A0A2R4TFV0_9ACTN|nr:hypothetical protein [Streptomyces lunaelactis]AVZ78012.1 hypothetical protein SLUN_38960 [Streptomyces lunaelactis]NUK84963.1 hypothetical protein [Streptomyces lunaelactis]
MNIIVAGQRIVSQSEFVEAAIGFTPTEDDLNAFAEFVAEGYGPADRRNEVDAENAFYFRRRKPTTRTRKPQAVNGNVVPLPRSRSGAGLAEDRKGWAA